MSTNELPAALSFASGVIAVYVGEYHVCAILLSGAVKCWGSNSKGQLGTGDTTDRSNPTAVSGLGSGANVCTGFKSVWFTAI